MINGAQAMVKCLESEGVSVVFGYPGATICPFYDSLSASSIHHVLVRQEQNGGHSANGYARIAGKPGVCIATSGPGATNLITALATAYMDSIPLIAITGQVATDMLGRDVFQEADITGAAEPFTKHSYLVKDVDQLPRIFKEAFYIAATGRPGPVLIDVPVDIQKKELSQPFSYPKQVNIIGYKPSIKGHGLQIKKVAEAMKAAQRPLICVGGGAFAADGYKAVRTLAETYQIPVISTMMGIGALPSEHPLYFGMLGTHGVPHANQAVHDADLLLIIGAKLAAPEQMVIAACGDGSFQMQMMELATICQDQVNVKMILFRNNKLGMVKEIQKNAYGERYIATNLDGSPDFLTLVSAYGIPCRRVSDIAQAEEAIEAFLSAQGPYLLECIVDPEESSK